MKRIAVLFALLLALSGGVLAMASCKQKEGKRCTTVQDCDEGLTCCFDGVAASEPLGVCLPEDECLPLDGGVTGDASVTQDASP